MFLLLLRQGGRDTVNRDGLTPLQMVDQAELQRFIVDQLDNAAEHEYAEIVDEEKPVTELGQDGAVGGVEAECRICSEPSELVIFQPCLHAVVCADCSDRYLHTMSFMKCVCCVGGGWMQETSPQLD